ncbi:MAG: hypothetical protein PHZ07_04950 [Patescibacteria group bacterium]|nr:hypothetical protein [Patescibacteria group bacterium]MDD4304705.1 hypothetical protein [Patescibacteria group bacterium]MDD4695733.1 hypothetical protein [Patescibacteria group bacterium]
MFHKIFNEIIEEINSVIKFMFNNKIFLTCLLIAIMVILFGFLFNLDKGEWNDILLTVSISMILSMNYSYAHKQKNVEKKRIVGTELICFTIVAIIIGWGIFYDKTIQNPMYIYHKISSDLSIVYLMCLIVPVIISIFFKIVRKSGEPLYGGIISGHATFLSSLLFINFHNKANWPLVIPSILYILFPRCMSLEHWYRNALRLISVISTAFLAFFVIIGKHNIVLIWADIFMLILLLISQGKKVHRKREVILGFVIGVICSITIIFIFG